MIHRPLSNGPHPATAGTPSRTWGRDIENKSGVAHLVIDSIEDPIVSHDFLRGVLLAGELLNTRIQNESGDLPARRETHPAACFHGARIGLQNEP
jgi:hypothetical protein